MDCKLFPAFPLQEPSVFEEEQREITGSQKQGNISARLEQQPKPGAGQRCQDDKGKQKNKPLRFPGIPEDTQDRVKTLSAVERFHRQQIESRKQQIALEKAGILFVKD